MSSHVNATHSGVPPTEVAVGEEKRLRAVDSWKSRVLPYVIRELDARRVRIGVSRTISNSSHPIARAFAMSSLLPTRGLVRRAFRKLIYREVRLGRYEITAGDSCAPQPPTGMVIDFLESPACDAVNGTNPYLSALDLSRLRELPSTSIVVYDGERIVASSWMTAGRVHLPELGRHINIPTGSHFLCRVYVSPEYRGRGLMANMIHAYSKRVAPSDVLWGLFYKWNEASIHSVEKLGWRQTGEYWTRFVLGKPLPRERLFPVCVTPADGDRT